MNLNFTNKFSQIHLCTNIEDVISKDRGNKLEIYSIVWITKGRVELLIDDIKASLHDGQMTFIIPLNYAQLITCQGEVFVVQFNR